MEGDDLAFYYTLYLWCNPTDPKIGLNPRYFFLSKKKKKKKKNQQKIVKKSSDEKHCSSKNVEFHEMEVNNFKILVYSVIIY